MDISSSRSIHITSILRSLHWLKVTERKLLFLIPTKLTTQPIPIFTAVPLRCS